jgi:excisionase family DNA binding protein
MASPVETPFWYRRLNQACAILLATSPFVAGKASGEGGFVKQVKVADLPLTMQSLADLPPVITVKEMARLLRLSRSAAYRRIQAGQIEAFKLRERWFVPTAPLKRKLGLP